MRRFPALAVLALLLTIVGALIALAVGTRSTDNGDPTSLTVRGGTPQCLPQTEVLPTAIPTEQWTPDWLAQWSQRAQEAAAEQVRRTTESIVSRHASMGDVPRVGLLISVSGPEDLDDALRNADEFVVGNVEAQYLSWEPDRRDGPRAVLASVVRVRDDSMSIVTQPAAVLCGENGVLLGTAPFSEPLEVGREYAVLTTTQRDGNLAAIRGHAYFVHGDALTTSSPQVAQTQLYDADTIAALSARFEAIKAGRQVSPRPTPSP